MDIYIFGDVVHFIYCRAATKILMGESQKIDTISSTMGNDAAIAALVLAKLKEKVNFISMSCLSANYLYRMEQAGISVINPKVMEPGGKTVLLEDSCGRRTFLSSSLPFLDEIRVPETAGFIYIDFYEEHLDILHQFLNEVEKIKCTQLYINLSSSHIMEKAEFLANHGRIPNFMQFSCNEYDGDQILEEVSHNLKGSTLIATYGSHGSCMLSNGRKHICMIDHPDGRNIMGAGSFFAAHFISAFCRTEHVVQAHCYASQEVTHLCQNGGNILLESLSQVGTG